MLKSIRAGDELTVFLCGEIDHCSAAALRNEIETILADQTITGLCLDFSGVSFMDSSGIGMIIGRYKTMKARQGRMTACGISPELERVYRIGGLHRIIPITERGRDGERE